MNDQMLLTTAEVAVRVRTSPETVRYWRHQGTGPRGFKVGRRVLYEENELSRWIAEKRDKQVPDLL